MALAAALAGCGFLPGAAPTALELKATPTADSEFAYSTVRFDARVVSVLNHFHPTFGAAFRGGHYRATNSIHAGDVVAITVYESGGQQLFPPPSVVPGAVATAAPLGVVSTGASNIPPQVVEADGTIFVPFVGRLKVAGMTPGQAGALIERDLQGKAVSPQVLVSLVNNIGTAATVGGEVNSPKPVALSARGERLLDVIAAAGGAKFPAYETYVRVVRNGKVGNVILQRIINDPNENIVVRPHDQVYLSHNPRTFAVLGASQKVATYPFPAEKVSLAEALAMSGGPLDSIGDLTGIYIFRFEPWFIAKDLVSPEYLSKVGPTPPEFVPILYEINLKDAETYFLAQAVQIRDKDVILITNSGATQLNKMIAVIRGFTGIAYDLRRQVVN